MSRRSSNNRDTNPFEESREPPSRRNASRRAEPRQNARPKKRRRWPWVLLFLLIVIGLLPNILGWTGLHQQAINFAASDFEGKVTVKQASLGWLQPISLSGVSATDAAGAEILSIESVTSSKPLYSFLTSADYGQFSINKPVAFVQLRPGGSNVEDALAKYLVPANEKAPSSAPSSSAEPVSLPKISVKLIDGRALITESTSPNLWQIDGLTAAILTAGSEAAVSVDAKCQVTPGQLAENGQTILGEGGSLEMRGLLDAGADTLKMGTLAVALAGNQFPLSSAGPLLQRFIGPTQADGRLSGSIQSNIDLNRGAMAIQIDQLQMSNFAFIAPALLGSDQLSVRNLTAGGSLQLSPKTISSSNFMVHSDFGRITANGEFDVQQLNQLASGSAAIPLAPLQMDGEIDLAGLVRMLPNTLTLHEDLEIESGTIRFVAGTKTESGTQRLVMNLDTANLKARRGNTPIVWQKPLRLVGTLIQSPTGMAIEDLLCESDFLSIAGSATQETGAFRAQGDLAALMTKLGEFIDLTGTRLAGQLDGQFGWQTASNPSGNPAIGQPIQIGGSFLIRNPLIQLPDMPVWQQPELSIKMSAAGHSLINAKTQQQLLSLESGGAQLIVGSEIATAKLAAPLQNAFTDPWSLNCELTGGLDGWLRHVRNFVDIGDISGSGKLELTCLAALSKNSLQLTKIKYDIQQMDFVGYGLKIREPAVSGTAVVNYDLTSGTIGILDTTLTASSIAARGQNLTIAFPPKNPEAMLVDGAVAFRADVNRVADWIELSPTEDSIFWFGNAEGSMQFVSNLSGIGGRLNSTITDLVAAQRAVGSNPATAGVQPVANSQPWTELFREAKTQIDSELIFANDFNAIGFQNLVVNSSAVELKAGGSISELDSQMVTDVKGSWSPDWKKVQQLLTVYAGGFVKLSGSGEQPFSVSGPLFAAADTPESKTAWIPAGLTAATNLRWDGGEVLGVPIGASQLNVDVRNSVGRLRTPGIPFSGGVIQIAPDVDLRGASPLVVMQPTRVIDNVALSPDTARQWMKYVAPLVADATSAQGNVTLDTQTLRVPMFDPMAMEATGTVRLTNVVIGAGPLADQLLGTISQIRAVLKPESSGRDLTTWLKMEEQMIPVMVKDRAVHHQNVTFSHNDTVVRTSGSVGFDQTLNMVAEIAIADDWIEGKRFLSSLKGQSLSIPISGTVSQPRLDRRAVEQLTNQLLRSAAGSALNEAIADKVTPKIGEFQNQVNDKLNNEVNKLQNKFGEKLGGFLPPPNAPATPPAGATPAPGTTPPASGTQPNLGQQLEGELLKGIGNLFGKPK